MAALGWLLNLGFGGSGATATDTQTYGGYVPPKYVKGRIRKKDESILQEVYKVANRLEFVDEPPKELEKRVKAVTQRAENAVRIQNDRQHAQEIRATMAQIKRLQVTIDRKIQADKADEEAAINALLSIL